MAERKNLLLLRHGEVQSPPGVYYGRRDYVLSPRGLEQAKRAGLRLQGAKVDKVYSSPLRRCLQTARLAWPGLGPTPLPELCDLDFGRWEEVPIEQAMQDAEAWENWTRRGMENAPPEGESLRAFQDRCAEARRRILSELADGQTALVVTHYGNLRSMVAQALGMGEAGAGSLACAPGSLARLEFLDGAPVLSLWNG